MTVVIYSLLVIVVERACVTDAIRRMIFRMVISADGSVSELRNFVGLYEVQFLIIH